MHANELVHLAALVAAQATLPKGSWLTPRESRLTSYWVASKCRLDRWQRALRRSPWSKQRPLIEEILVSEVLTRTWTGFLALQGLDPDLGADSIAQSVLQGHLDARRRALRLLMHAASIPIADAIAINQLRRRAERWTDLLLGRLSAGGDMSHLSSDPERVRDFALDWQDKADAAPEECWTLLLDALQKSFPASQWHSPNADLNERIAASVLCCFPTEIFQSVGPFHSLWMLRMRHAADDAQGMLDQLWRLERSSQGLTA